ncbi:MAG TPA: alpha/beta fold hydrolase [Pseudonocardiaceae bacterium]
MTGHWLRRFHRNRGTRLLLVCLPHAGGTATFYRGWHERLPHWVDVAAVQYPGRQERYREPCLTDVRELAAGVTAEVLDAGSRPVVLYGHSMGAVVAYETAVLLSRAGRGPAQLVVSGHSVPRLARPGTVHLGSDEELAAELRRLGGTDAGLFAEPELWEFSRPSIRADYQAIETYRPATPAPVLSCRLTVFHGADDPDVPEDEARAWAEVTTGRFGFRAWPGDHFFLTEHEPALLGDLAIRLAAADPAALP